MPVPSLRARSATEIVDASFQILKAHYAQFVVCSAIAYVPLLLMRLFVIGDSTRFLSPDSSTLQGGFLVIMAWTMLATWLTFSLMSAVLLVCTSQAYLGEPVDVGIAVRRVLPRLISVLVAGLLRYILLIIGFVLLFVPGFYVVARYFAVTPAIVLENAGPFSAFSRSSELSRGRKLHVLGTLLLVVIIYYLLVMGISLLGLLLRNFVVQTVVSGVASIVIYPVVAIAEALLYYDARIQSEGLDIELMTGALAPASPGYPAA
jgi:hypothetical protein